jgi:hypothetical protein
MADRRLSLDALVHEIIDVTPPPHFTNGPEHNGYALHVAAALSQTKVMDFRTDRYGDIATGASAK